MMKKDTLAKLRATVLVLFACGQMLLATSPCIDAPYVINLTNGVPYLGRTLTASDFPAGYWSANKAPVPSLSYPLCPGMWLSPSGLISGTPAQIGTNTYLIRAMVDSRTFDPILTTNFTFKVVQGLAPSINTPPQSQTVALGSNVTFWVGASGNSLSYVWKYNGSVISTATGSSFGITNIALTNAGTYAVVVSNAGGPVSASATLTVVVPPAITQNPADCISVLGSNVTFHVAGSGGGLNYRWFFNSNLLVGQYASQLALIDLSIDQSGLYSAIVSNAAGVATSSVARLLVVAPLVSNSAPTLWAGPASPGQVSLDFTARAGYRHCVQYNDDLSGTNWTLLQEWPPAFAESNVFLPQPVAQSNRFYRVMISCP